LTLAATKFNLVTILMRFMFSILFLGVLSQTCKDAPKLVAQKVITKLDFSYSFPLEATFYSLKFSTSDTAYIKDFSPPRTDTSFQTVFPKEDRSKIDNLISNLNLSALDSSYDYRDIDGDAYNLKISKNDTLKTIYIHGGDVPVELRTFIDYIAELKTKLTKHTYDKNN